MKVSVLHTAGDAPVRNRERVRAPGGLSKRRGKLSSSMDAGNWVLPPAQMARLTQSMLSTSVVLNTLKLGGRLSLRPRSIGIGRTANANEPEKPPVLRAELSLDNLNLDDFQHLLPVFLAPLHPILHLDSTTKQTIHFEGF